MIEKKNISKIFLTLSKKYSDSKTELIYKNNFELLIAVMLSAQSTDKSVNKATIKLFKKYNSPKRIITLGEKKLKEYIKTIGLYNDKAKNIISTCKILIKSYDGEVPDKFEYLIKLPGVGRKTANVILNEAFGKSTIAVDTHVYRVSKRLKLSEGKTPLVVEKDLMSCVPKKYLSQAHIWLIMHGRYTCLARKPKCPTCEIKNFCDNYRRYKV